MLSSTEIGLVGGVDVTTDNAAALRIALLWDELLDKLRLNPSAALGLLDIANSGKVKDSSALGLLEPALADAIQRASTTLPDAEAWDFLGAIVRKMKKHAMAQATAAIGDAAREMAGRAPAGAVALLAQPDPNGIVADLLPRIADGIGEVYSDQGRQALVSTSPQVLARFLAEGGLLTKRIADDSEFVERLGVALPELDSALVDAVSDQLLPYLVEDWQLQAAAPLLARLDAQRIASEARHLGEANDFAATGLADLVVKRARQIGAAGAVRASLVALPRSDRRDAVLASTLEPTIPDVAWILGEPELSADITAKLTVDLLRSADDHQAISIVTDSRIGDDVLRVIERHAGDVAQRLVFVDSLSLPTFIRLAGVVMPRVDAATKARLAERALRKCLVTRFDGDEQGFLTTMLGIIGDRLDGAWAARIGLDPHISASIASRNMIAFRKASQPARLRFVWSIAEVAQVLRARRGFDLDAAAADACAALFFEAEQVTPSALLIAAGHLVTMLLGERKRPVSMMIAALFPSIYREAAKEDDVPDLLKFVPFFDWSRSKAARHELVSAFMHSSWEPGDLALTAWRCGEPGKILRRVAKQYGGGEYLDRVAWDLKRLPPACQTAVKRCLKEIKSDWASKYDWRD